MKFNEANVETKYHRLLLVIEDLWQSQDGSKSKPDICCGEKVLETYK